MKETNTNLKAGEQQELEQFDLAAGRLVSRAKANKSVAQKFLRDINYAVVMSDARSDSNSDSSFGVVFKSDPATSRGSAVKAPKSKLPKRKPPKSKSAKNNR